MTYKVYSVLYYTNKKYLSFLKLQTATFQASFDAKYQKHFKKCKFIRC